MNRRIYACLNRKIVTSIIIHPSIGVDDIQISHNDNATPNERPQIGAKDYRWLGFRHVLVGSVELCLKIVLHRPSLRDVVVVVIVVFSVAATAAEPLPPSLCRRTSVRSHRNPLNAVHQVAQSRTYTDRVSVCNNLEHHRPW